MKQPLRMPTYQRTLAVCVALILALAAGVTAPAPPAQAQDLLSGLLSGVEVLIGGSVAQDVYEQYGPPVKLVEPYQSWVDETFANLIAHVNRKEIPYQLEVLDSEVVNAFAAPGGYLFITTGLLKHLVGDTDALANVLGHEIAHVEHRHGMNSITRQLGIGLLLQLVFGGGEGDEVLRTVAAVATELMRLGWSREQEHESDDLGQRLAAAAGYDPYGMVRFFEVLQAMQGEELPFLEFLSTHPLTSERTERARARAASLPVAPRPEQAPQPEPIPQADHPGAGSHAEQASTDHAETAEADGDTRPSVRPEGSGSARVLTRGGGQPVGGIDYHDPAQRFSLRLPAGWSDDPWLFLHTTQFPGPEGQNLWVVVEEAHARDTSPFAAARRAIEYYRSLFRDLTVTTGIRESTLAGHQAAYLEYQYTDDVGGARVKEGAYFLLHSGLLISLQYMQPESHSEAMWDAFSSVARSFQIGPHPFGRVPSETLRQSRVDSHTFFDFTIDISELWPVTWTPDPTHAADEVQLAELVEIGDDGFLGIYLYSIDPWITAVDTATDWLDWLRGGPMRVAVIEPVHRKRIGGAEAASFVVAWEDDDGRWLQYSTTIVSGNHSYEFAIVYRAEGFHERRPIFDRWLASWRRATT